MSAERAEALADTLPPIETLRFGVWHRWGLVAPVWGSIPQLEGDQHLIDHMKLAIVPSYWGMWRRELLQQHLDDIGVASPVVTLAEAMLTVESATVTHSILVEVEEHQVCLTRLSNYDGASRLVPSVGAEDAAALVETVIAAAYQLTHDPEDIHGIPDLVEVNGGRGITEYPPLWVESLELIVAEVPPGLPRPRRFVLADRLRRRGFLVFEPPVKLFGADTFDTLIDRGYLVLDADESSELASEEEARDAASATPSHPLQRIFPQLRGGTELDSVGRRKSLPSATTALGMALLCVLGVVGIGGALWLGPQLRGAGVPGEQVVAAPSEAGAGPDVSPTGPADALPQELTQQEGSMAEPAAVELSAAGVAVSMRPGWEVAETGPLDRLIVENGGNMRVVVVGYPLHPEADLDHVVAGLSSQVAINATMSVPVRTNLYGLDVVTAQERPPSGRSVVLWHHRIVEGVQISVGCQFRGSTIAPERPDCEQAVKSARPV